MVAQDRDEYRRDDPLGEQATRTLTSADGSMSRTMTWNYYPDGKLSSLADNGIPTGLASELVDDSDFNNTGRDLGLVHILVRLHRGLPHPRRGHRH